MAEECQAAQRFGGLATGAARTGLSISTLQKWVRAKKLTGYQPSGSGKILIDLRQLDDVILRSAKV